MTPRSIRRAAERKAEKEARQFPVIDPEPSAGQSPSTPVSTAKLAANRANAQKSTGPSTAEGKQITRFNAVRHNLTGRTILLLADDAALYRNHCQAFWDDLKPLGVREELLVQNIADHHWRLARIPALEAGIYALGVHRSGIHPDPKVIADSREVETYLAHEKQLRNLHLQEARLARYLKNDMAELKTLQQIRLDAEQQLFEAAAALAAAAQAAGQAFDPHDFGFVFSKIDLQAFADAKGNLVLAKKLSELRSRRAESLALAA